MNDEDFDENKTLSVGELAARSGVAISAIHFYETKKLIKSTRNKLNQRRFHRRELRVLAYIKVAQKLGLSLEEVKEGFKSLPANRTPSNSDWQKISRDWNKILEERIKIMMKVKNQLNYCIGCGCLSLKDCPLRNPEDKCSKMGSGAQFILRD